MSTKQRPRKRGRAGHVAIKDVRFMEVEFAVPIGTRMVIELEGGMRLTVADDSAVEIAAEFVNYLRKGGGE